MTGETYTEGQAVYVRCIGVWYAGTVRKVTPKRVMVDFTTGSGKRRWKFYPIAAREVRATLPDVPLGQATRYEPCPYGCGRRYDRRKLERHKATCTSRPRPLTADQAQRMFEAIDEAKANREWHESHREPVCAYAATAATVNPAFRCPAECAGPLVYRVRDYWRGPARAKLGPDMVLCEAHGAWYGTGNPLGPRAERIRSGGRS